jgi:hypothetical protein
MLAGRHLYSDLWDHKPPAIHITFAAGELVAGYFACEKHAAVSYPTPLRVFDTQRAFPYNSPNLETIASSVMTENP